MSIGILSGQSPWDLTDDPRWPGPILTADSVSDAPADFVADPFCIKHKDSWFLFFEFMNRRTGKGEIGCTVSPDLIRWSYCGTVLIEPFHLSYPAVYREAGEFWMVPETWESGEVRLYRADPFPSRWVLDRVLVPSLTVTDPTIFKEQSGEWGMLACEAGRVHNSTLVSLRAPQLFGPWRPNPLGPSVVGRPDQARPGGHVFSWDRQLHRLGQDCSARYGEALRSYPLSSPWTESSGDVVVGSGTSWRSLGGHHADLHWQADTAELLAFVDGEMPHDDAN